MDTIKTRKQGNAIMVTIPKSFNVDEGVALKPKLTDKGIFYEFVNNGDFFDFDEAILSDLITEGYEGNELLNKFKAMKKNMPKAMDKIIAEVEAETSPAMSKEEFEKVIGL